MLKKITFLISSKKIPFLSSSAIYLLFTPNETFQWVKIKSKIIFLMAIAI